MKTADRFSGIAEDLSQTMARALAQAVADVAEQIVGELEAAELARP